MVLKSISSAVLGTVLMLAGVSGGVWAADRHGDEFLDLDLAKALLSPKPLGPATEFAPVPTQAEGEPSDVPANSDAKAVAVQRVRGPLVHSESKPAPRHELRIAHAHAAKPRGASRVRLAHRPGNPLNAQAMDSRIQKWPCNSYNGGICGWRQ